MKSFADRHPNLSIALLSLVLLAMALAMNACGDNPSNPDPVPSASPSPSAVVFDVHVFAFSGKAVDPANSITEVDQGEQFKVGLTMDAYDVATGKLLPPDSVPPFKVRWRQTNRVGLCTDRGALDSHVEQEVCWESTGIDKATFEGAARSLLDGKELGSATYGVTVR